MYLGNTSDEWERQRTIIREISLVVAAHLIIDIGYRSLLVLGDRSTIGSVRPGNRFVWYFFKYWETPVRSCKLHDPTCRPYSVTTRVSVYCQFILYDIIFYFMSYFICLGPI